MIEQIKKDFPHGSKVRITKGRYKGLYGIVQHHEDIKQTGLFTMIGSPTYNHAQNLYYIELQVEDTPLRLIYGSYLPVRDKHALYVSYLDIEIISEITPNKTIFPSVVAGKLSVCPICNKPGEDMLFKFYCSNEVCKNYHP